MYKDNGYIFQLFKEVKHIFSLCYFLLTDLKFYELEEFINKKSREWKLLQAQPNGCLFMHLQTI